MKIGIIGCGIIGSYLGYKLANEHDVEIFEKKEKIGGKACSGMISERIWNFIPENKELVLNIIDYANIHFPRKIGAGKFAPRLYDKTIKLNFKPKMLVFDRQKLDEYAADLAKGRGAKIQMGYEVKRIFHIKGKKPSISVSHGGKIKVHEFDLLIGADGANSIVRRQLGLKEPRYRLGIYTYKKMKGKKDVNFVDTYATKNGFFWKIPRRNDIEYGIIEKPEKANDDLNIFCKKFKLKREDVFSALIPEGPIVSNNGKIVLCGDAAGLTKPWSGGGVIWGMTAGDILVNNVRNLKKYKRKIKNKFGFKIFTFNIKKKLAYSGLHSFLSKEIVFDADW